MTSTADNQAAQPDRPPKKWWAESLTLWGAFITAISTVLPVIGPLFGIDVSSAIIEQIGAHIATIIQALGGIGGLLMTIAGRARASKPLALKRN